jgi:hypothetical protein
MRIPDGRALVPGPSGVLFLATLASLLAGRVLLLGDGDTGWHIRVGELILESGQIPRHDPYSVITPPIPWTAHEWLAEVIMALCHRWAGLGGVALAHAVVLAAATQQGFLLVRAECRNLFVAFGFAVLMLSGSLLHFLARPHAYTFLLLATWMRILDGHRRGDLPARRLALLPVTMIPWINLHGGAIVGLVLLGLEWLAALGQGTARSRALGKTLAASVVATMLNPQGPAILLFPLRLQAQSKLMSSVSEFIPPSSTTAPVFAFTLLLLLVVLGRSSLALTRVELARLLTFGFMAFRSIRYTTQFAMMAAPMLAGRVDAWLTDARPGRLVNYLRSRSEAFAAMEAHGSRWLWPAIGLVVATLVVDGGHLPTTFDPKVAPLAAIQHMLARDIRGNGFHSDEFGDQLIYAAPGRYRIFIDGRLDMYGEEWVARYTAATLLKPELDEILERYAIRWILYPGDSPLMRVMRTRPGWRVDYEDKVATLLVREP